MIIPKANELSEEEKRKVEETPKYAEIDKTIICLREWHKQGLTPYNIPLVIELKRDGSNMRLIHLSEDRYGLLSRNQYASDDFINRVLRIIELPYLAKHAAITGRYHKNIFEIAKSGYTVYFELFGTGVFPGYDIDSPPSMEVLDILTPESGFLRRKAKEDICEKYKAPIVPLLWQGEVKNLDEYWMVVRPLVDKTWKEMHKEGIVIKGFARNFGQIFIKEKHPDVLNEAKEQKREVGGALQVDTRAVLDETEIMGAIKKVHVEIGSQIEDKAVAMPRIAVRIHEECNKHDKRFPRDIYDKYVHYLNQIKTMPNLIGLEDIE